MVGLVHSLKNKKEVFMNVNDLAKQVSSIITPQTDNFYRDIRIYGHFFHNTNDTMWWGDVGMKFLTRAPFDVRWLREERLDDPYGGFLYEATVKPLLCLNINTTRKNMINLGLIFHPVPTNFSIPIIRFCEPDCGVEPCVHAMRMLSI